MVCWDLFLTTLTSITAFCEGLAELNVKYESTCSQKTYVYGILILWQIQSLFALRKVAVYRDISSRIQSDICIHDLICVQARHCLVHIVLRGYYSCPVHRMVEKVGRQLVTITLSGTGHIGITECLRNGSLFYPQHDCSFGHASQGISYYCSLLFSPLTCITVRPPWFYFS